MVIGAESIGYEITKAAVVALVKPLLTATFAGAKNLSQAALDVFGDRFCDYIAIQAQRHSCLSTIVFGHQKQLSDLYIPLTVVPTRDAELDADQESKGIRIDRFHTALLPAETRVLITDTAGMGKSTLSKFLFLQCLKSAYAVPIFIELRHLTAANGVFSVLQKQLNTTSVSEDAPKFTKRQIEKILKKGGLVLFLDGYDEINFKDRETVTKDVKELIEKYPDNIYVITSRPETGLLSFPSFKQFGIRPLKKLESFELIKKYDQGSGRAEQLIGKLKGRDFHAVQEFLKNPLLTSLLYRSFEYKQNVPIKKHIFYRQVFDALFDWHDATKDGYNTREKRSGLDVDQFHRMLRVIGFVSVMKGEIEGDTDAVLSWIRKARDICNLSLAESNFLDDLIRAVPIFVRDGDLYRWSHKSLAEYFAAQYICTEGRPQQGSIFNTFLSSVQLSRFSNVLDQVYDIDISGFRANLILPMARAFSTYWASSYVGMNPSIDAGDVRLRKAVTFDRTFIVLRMPLDNLKSLRETIDNALEKRLGESLRDKRRTVKALFADPFGRSGGRNGTMLLAVADGPFCTILDILQSKKDPLIVSRASLMEPRGRITVRVGEPIVISDDPEDSLNSATNFPRTTAMLMLYAPVPDASRLLAFEASFRDDARLAELADELLKGMQSENS